MTQEQIERLIKPEPPERIYGWMNSQLSVARHYGGYKLHGTDYVIAENEEGSPLVRWDVIQREAKEKRDGHRAKKQFEALNADKAQGSLI